MTKETQEMIDAMDELKEEFSDANLEGHCEDIDNDSPR